MIPYAKLRGELMAREISHEDFAKGIGMSLSALSRKINAHVMWDLNEVYRVMDFLELPYTVIPDYFPKDGRTKPKGCTQRFPDFATDERRIAR